MHLFNRTKPDETELKFSGVNQTWLNRVIDHIHNHFNEDIKLEKMAGISRLSPYHFHRRFRAIMGETPSCFVRRVRLEKSAHILMLEKYKPITSIALECGFSSSQNFSRSFKSQFKESPSVMRESFNWYSVVSTIQQIKNGTLTSKTKDVIFLEQFIRDRKLTLKEMLKEPPPAEVEIKILPPRRVAYIRTIGASYSYKAVKPAFEQLEQWALARNLLTRSTHRLGVTWNSTELTPADKLIHDVCIEIPKNVKPDKWVSVQTLPGGAFAIYHSTAQVQQYVNQYEFMRLFYWLLVSEYRPEGPPYSNVFLKKAKDHPRRQASVDICIPVKPLWD